MSITDTVPVSWSLAERFNGNATVDDDQESDLPVTVAHGEGPWTWTEIQQHTCSTSATEYGDMGTYATTVSNTAMVTGTDGQTDSATATTTYSCAAGFVEVLKLTSGDVDPSMMWSFSLFEGPDGHGATQIGSTSSTLGDDDGILECGSPTLRPDRTYTACELEVAAGWATFWRVDTDDDGVADTTIVPYNPNADDNPPEDLGNRCVDFGAGTSIPVVVGNPVHLEVNNASPGGSPRTPGYWKNWNQCTGGNQQFTAEVNGGWQEGFWLLEDVLDPSIGGGIIWDDILADDQFEYVLQECQEAVLILDKRDGRGRKVASDPLHNLATHLLAAQLNLGAGACTTPDVQQSVLAAERLLDKYDFTVDGHSMKGRKGKNGSNNSDTTLASELAGELDAYNNGRFCGDTVA